METSGNNKHPLRHLVQGWINKIEACDEHRKDWLSVAEECNKFFQAKNDFLWAEENAKFWHSKETKVQPTFRMTFAKAFEFVALIGPMIYNRNPTRTVTPRRRIKIPMELFVQQPQPTMDPMAQQQAMMMYQQQVMQYQMMEQQELVREAEDRVRAELMQGWLNYTPNEQPFGGLMAAAQKATQDAMVKGRGTLWHETYSRPGSPDLVTGAFYDKPENLYVDPDAERWQDVQWIARRCVAPYWQLERECAQFGLQPGVLKEYGKKESLTSQSEGNAFDKTQTARKSGKTNDLITYYRIWSKMGVGSRLKNQANPSSDAIQNKEFMDSMDELVGDYAYLIVADGVPFPLNLPTDVLVGEITGDPATAETDSAITSNLQWPVPLWKDSLWPVSILDFYCKTDSTLPIAPLEPGLGELKYLNILISHIANRTWMSSRDFIAIKKAAEESVESAINEGKDLTVIKLGEMDGKIDELITFLQQPQMNKDIWMVAEAVMEIFDKRVGLSDLMYSMNPGGTQPRTAAEMQVKQSSMQIRPDYMKSRVEEWQTHVARIEAITARWFIQPQMVQKLFGDVGSMLWQTYIMDPDPDKVVAELEFRIESGSAAKPDKDKNISNANQVVQLLSPNLFAYGQATGNYEPFNGMLKDLGGAMDYDIDKYLLPSTPPPMPAPAEGGEEQAA